MYNLFIPTDSLFYCIYKLLWRFNINPRNIFPFSYKDILRKHKGCFPSLFVCKSFIGSKRAIIFFKDVHVVMQLCQNDVFKKYQSFPLP